MPSANKLTDDPAAYTYVPPLISPVSDDPEDPDSQPTWKMPRGTVKSVRAYPRRNGNGNEEAY
jgi:hypothetical protein